MCFISRKHKYSPQNYQTNIPPIKPAFKGLHNGQISTYTLLQQFKLKTIKDSMAKIVPQQRSKVIHQKQPDLKGQCICVLSLFIF